MESNEVISGEEADALRESAGAADLEPRADAGGVRALDPDHWDRIFKDRAPALESIAERMVSRFKQTGRRFFRESISVTADPARMVRWGLYIRKLSVPASMHELEIKPLGLSGVLCLDSAFVFSLADKFFGGSGEAERPAELNEFTAMEERLVRRFVEALVQDMESSWKPLVDLQFVLGRSESNPLFLSIAADSDSLSITTFTFEFAERQFSLDIALPSVLIEPMQFVGKKAAQGSSVSSLGWHSQIKEDVQDARVTLRAELAKTQINLRDLTTARPGDVIPIEAPNVVTLLAGDQPVFEGSFGIIRERHAVQVTRQVSADKPGDRQDG